MREEFCLCNFDHYYSALKHFINEFCNSRVESDDKDIVFLVFKIELYLITKIIYVHSLKFKNKVKEEYKILW